MEQLRRCSVARRTRAEGETTRSYEKVQNCAVGTLCNEPANKVSCVRGYKIPTNATADGRRLLAEETDERHEWTTAIDPESAGHIHWQPQPA